MEMRIVARRDQNTDILDLLIIPADQEIREGFEDRKTFYLSIYKEKDPTDDREWRVTGVVINYANLVLRQIIRALSLKADDEIEVRVVLDLLWIAEPAQTVHAIWISEECGTDRQRAYERARVFVRDVKINPSALLAQVMTTPALKEYQNYARSVVSTVKP